MCKYLFVLITDSAPLIESQTMSDSEKGKSKLGTYRVAIIPMLVFIMDLCCGYYVIKTEFTFDPRVKGWFLLESPVTMAIIGMVYIMFSVVWGPKLMKGRKPMQLKEVMLFYNGFQVMFSLFMFIEVS